MKPNLFKRILALMIILIIVSLFVGVIYCIITGSKYLLPMVFTSMIVPVIVYLFVWVGKVFSKDEEKGSDTDGRTGYDGKQ